MSQGDYMDIPKHPDAGLCSDGKSTFRKMTRASACVEVEDPVPTSPLPPKQLPHRRQKAERVEAIKGAMRQHGMDVL